MEDLEEIERQSNYIRLLDEYVASLRNSNVQNINIEERKNSILELY